MYFCLAVRRDILWRPDFQRWEEWYRISLNWQPLRIRNGLHRSLRTGPSSIGHTGWYGVAAPFFIGSISRGRTVRQTIVGGYVFGVGSTIISFIILGNYSLGAQVMGKADFLAIYEKSGDLYEVIISIIRTLPCAPLVLVLLLLTMIAFYATSFDSIALIASCYSYHRLKEDETPHKVVELMWCVLLILLPIALVFSDSSMSNLQSVSIIAAFPVGAVIVLIVASFLKDAKKYMEEIKK